MVLAAAVSSTNDFPIPSLSLKSVCDQVKETHSTGERRKGVKKSVSPTERATEHEIQGTCFNQILKPLNIYIPSLLSESILNKQWEKSFVSVLSEKK